jgi:hypothetical protein
MPKLYSTTAMFEKVKKMYVVCIIFVSLIDFPEPPPVLTQVVGSCGSLLPLATIFTNWSIAKWTGPPVVISLVYFFNQKFAQRHIINQTLMSDQFADGHIYSDRSIRVRVRLYLFLFSGTFA